MARTPPHDITAHNSSPLEFLLSVMRDETRPIDQRMQAAIGAAPYCHSTCQIIDRREDDGQLKPMTSLPPRRSPVGH